jgi:hypothetical protein
VFLQNFHAPVIFYNFGFIFLLKKRGIGPRWPVHGNIIK